MLLHPKTLTVEHAGEPLSAYEVAYDVRPQGHGSGISRLLAVKKPMLFVTPFVPHQPRLFGLAEPLSADGWLKASRLDDYAPRAPRRPGMLQQALFAHMDAV